MMVKWSCFVVVLMAAALLADVSAGDSSDLLQVKKVKGERVCTKGWECKPWSKFCCNETISDYFQVYNFEQIFSKRNTPVAQAVGFWDYQSFIIAASDFEHLGFGTTGDGTEGDGCFLRPCGYGVATGGPLAWGLCYNREMSPNQDYCDNSDEYKYTLATLELTIMGVERFPFTGTTTMDDLVKLSKLICLHIQNTWNRMPLWPSRLQSTLG